MKIFWLGVDGVCPAGTYFSHPERTIGEIDHGEIRTQKVKTHKIIGWPPSLTCHSHVSPL